MRHLFWCVTLAAFALGGPQWGIAGEAEDTETAQRVAKALRDSGRVKDYRIGVKCKDGSVWLAGSVTSDKQMQAALEVASETGGVRRIINNLDVNRSSKPASESQASPTSGLVSQASAQAAVAPAAAANLGAAAKPAAPAAKAPAARKKSSKTGKKKKVAVYRGVPTGYSEVQEPETLPAQRAPMMAPSRPLPMYANGGAAPGMYPVGAYGMGAQGGAYGPGGVPAPAYDSPSMPNYAWPSYAASPNYAAVTYPRQYSATAWPFIGPFYPYPQVPLGWRKVSLEWDDGWWFLDFEDRSYQ